LLEMTAGSPSLVAVCERIGNPVKRPMCARRCVPNPNSLEWVAFCAQTRTLLRREGDDEAG